MYLTDLFIVENFDGPGTIMDLSSKGRSSSPKLTHISFVGNLYFAFTKLSQQCLFLDVHLDLLEFEHACT